MGKVILFVAMSQDGFIADKNGNVDWLPQNEDPQDECGYKALMNQVSTIIMGSRSYQQILGFGDWAWGGKETFVFTSQSLKSPRKDIHFVNEGVKSFIDKLRQQGPSKDIWLLGGAELVKSFAKERLIDECIITIIPTILGEGIKLELPYEDFDLTKVKTCMDGIEQKVYVLK